MADWVAVLGTNSDQAIDNGTFASGTTSWVQSAVGGGTTVDHVAPVMNLTCGPSGTTVAKIIQTITMSASTPFYQYGTTAGNGFTGTFTFDVRDIGVAASVVNARIYFIDKQDGATERVIATVTNQALDTTASVDILAATAGAVYAWPIFGDGVTDAGATPGTEAVLNRIYVEIWVDVNGKAAGVTNASLEMNTMTVGAISSDAAVCRSGVSGTVAKTISAPTVFKAATGTYKWFHDTQLCYATTNNEYGYTYGIPGAFDEEGGEHTYIDDDPQVIEGFAAGDVAEGRFGNFGTGIQDMSQISSNSPFGTITQGGTTYYPIGNNDKATITVSGTPTDGCAIHINGSGAPGFTLTEGVHWHNTGSTSAIATSIRDAFQDYISHPKTSSHANTAGTGMGETPVESGITLCYEVNNTSAEIVAVNITKRGANYNGTPPALYDGTITGTLWLTHRNILKSGSGFVTTDTFEANTNLLSAYGEVALVRTGTCDAGSTNILLIDTSEDAFGRGLNQNDNFWIGGTVEIIAGTGVGKSATVTDSDASSRSLSFAAIGADLDTTSEYRVTSVGTRGIESIAVTNGGSGYNMSVPYKGTVGGVTKDGCYTETNVVHVLSPWIGGSDSATHYCDFVGDWINYNLGTTEWSPHPRSPSKTGGGQPGTTPMPMKTLASGEKIPYYTYPVQHSATLGATRQFARAYPTDSGKVVAKDAYVLTVTGDSAAALAVTAFTGSTASLVIATLPYRGSTNVALGNGLTHQRNKFYERDSASAAAYGAITSATAANLQKFIIESSSKTHDLTAFKTLGGAATTYWGEKHILDASLATSYGSSGRYIEGFTDPSYTAMLAPLDYPHSASDDTGGLYPYYCGMVCHYLLAWEFSGCEDGVEQGSTTTTSFRYLYNAQGIEEAYSDWGQDMTQSHALATTAAPQGVYSTASAPTITYGYGLEDGRWKTTLATLPGGSPPQGGSYTYRWIDTHTELIPTPVPQVDLNIVASGTPGGAGTFYEEAGPGGIDSGVSPATVSINNITGEYDTFFYKFEFGWLDAGGTVFTGLSTTDWQGSPIVSNAPSTNTTGADATAGGMGGSYGSGVTNDFTDGDGGADLYTYPYNTANKYQLNCTSANEQNIADQVLLFNSTIATSQGHPTYVEYIIRVSAFETGGACPAQDYSNAIRIYRDLSATSGSMGAIMAASNDDIMETETITFHALDSSPGNSNATGDSLLGVGHTYSWDFSYDAGDGHGHGAPGQTGSGLTVSKQFNSPGTFSVRLLMTDFDGDTSAVEKSVVVTDRVGIPDEFVIQVYQTEAQALEGDLTDGLYAYENTGKLTLADNYYIYRDYWYRIESNDAVDGFYIDWDDGEDNSSEKSNSQIIMMKEPQFFTVIPHTYTKNGRFFPLVRAIKNDIHSKYYTNGVTAAQLSAQASDLSITIDATLNDYTALETEALENGNNEFSIVHPDSFGTEQTRFVPFLEPRNLPPVGILKTDRNAIYAGIDNSGINTTSGADSQRVYMDDDTGVAEASDSYIEATVVYEDNQGRIKTDDWNTWDQRKAAGGTAFLTNRILSIKLINLLENTGSAASDSLRAQDRVYLKTKDADEVVATVSLGSPYLNINQARYSVVADASESRTRGSNNSIASYYFTDGVTNASTVGVWSTGTQVTDVYNSGTFAYTHSKKRFMYTFDEANFKHFKDPDNRFYDYEMLIKLQVKDNHTDYSGYDRYYYSKIQDYNNDTYNTGITPDFLKRNASLRFFDTTAGTWSNTVYNTEGTKLETLIDGTYGGARVSVDVKEVVTD